MTAIADYKVPPMFSGCDFGDTTMPDGTRLFTESEPIVLNNGNVVFPLAWSGDQKVKFRRDNNIPGVGYPCKS